MARRSSEIDRLRTAVVRVFSQAADESGRKRRRLGWLWCGVVLLLSGLGVPAHAQTATVSLQFMQSTVGSGLGTADAVAVGAAGNVLAGYGSTGAVMTMAGATIYTAPAPHSAGALAMAADSNGVVYIASPYASEGGGVYVTTATFSGGAWTVSSSPLFSWYGTTSACAGNTVEYHGPAGIAVDGSSNVYISFSNDDLGQGGCVLEWTNSGGYATPSSSIADLDGKSPSGLAFYSNGVTNYLYYANGTDVYQYNLSVPAVPSDVLTVGTAVGVAVDNSGNVYAVGSGSTSVVDSSGTIGNALGTPAAVAVTPRGDRVYVANSTSSIPAIYLDGRLDSVNLGSNQKYSFYFSITGASTTLNAPSVLTQGQASLDFTDVADGSCDLTTGPYGVGTNSCYVDVEFKPTAPGLRTGALVLTGSNQNSLTVPVSGIGVGPVIAVAPGAQTPVASTGTGPAAIATGATSSAYDVYWVTPAGYIYKNAATSVRDLSGTIAGAAAGLAVGGDGTLYVLDNAVTSTVWALALPYATATPVDVGVDYAGAVSSLAIDQYGNLFIGEGTTLVKYNRQANGTFVAASPSYFGGTYPGTYPHNPIAAVDVLGLWLDANDYLYVADNGPGPYLPGVFQINYLGTSGTRIDNSAPGASGVNVDAAGNVYFTAEGSNALYKSAPPYGSQNSMAGTYSAPAGIALDQNGSVYVANTGNNEVLELNRGSGQTFNLGSTSYETPVHVDIAVENVGNSSLTLGHGVTPFATSSDPEFTVDETVTNHCSSGGSGSLLSGGSCVLRIVFTPTVGSGTPSATLTLTDNTLGTAGSTQTFTVQGTATKATPSFTGLASSATINYGTATITVSGTISAGTAYPTGNVSIQVGTGATVTAPISASNGSFSTTYDTHAIPYSATAYTITYSYGGDANFNAATPDASTALTVNQALLTFTALAQAKTYGQADPSATGTLTLTTSGGTVQVTGLVNGDPLTVITGSPALAFSGATSGTARPAGTYDITPGAGTMTASNYNIAGSAYPTLSNGLTVNQALLTFTALAQAKTYGQADPSATGTLTLTTSGGTVQVTGLVNSDPLTAITGSPALVFSGATSGALRPAGTYNITPGAGTMTASNYNIAGSTYTMLNNGLTVGPATTKSQILSMTLIPTDSGATYTFKAQVTPQIVNIPTGHVIFQDTVNGVTSNLSSAVALDVSGDASYTSTATQLTAAGLHTVTALYQQDDPDFAAATTPTGIGLTVASAIATSAGTPLGNLQINVSNPVTEALTNGSCTVLDGNDNPVVNTVCSVNPTQITLSTTSTSITVTIGTSAGSSAALRPPGMPFRTFYGGFGMILPGFVLLPLAAGKGSRRRLAMWLGLLLLATSLIALAGCGGGFSNSQGLQPNTGGAGATQAGSYTVAVNYLDANQNKVTVATIPLHISQ